MTMVVITIGLMCLLELKKEQLDKNRKITVLKNSLKTCFISLFKKNTFKKTFVLKQADISSSYSFKASWTKLKTFVRHILRMLNITSYENWFHSHSKNKRATFFETHCTL